MNLEEIIKKHLYIEYECNDLLKEGIILEKYGLFNDAKMITDKIIKQAEQKIKEGERRFQINIETNFGEIFLDFKILIVKYGDERNGKGGYHSFLSIYNKKTKKLENCSFIFSLKLYPNESIEHYRPLFYHELTHFYEDWNRQRKNKESLYNYSDRNNYYNNVITKIDDGIWAEVRNIIYFLHDSEKRAYMAMIKGILDNNQHLYTAQECFDEIKKTKPYLFYKKVGKDIEKLKQCNNVNLQNDIIQYFQNHGYKKVKNWNNLIKSIDRKYFNFMEKMGKNIGKLVFDYFEALKKHTTDWGINF